MNGPTPANFAPLDPLRAGCYARAVRACLAALALALACSACAGRTTQASRTAWDKALARRSDPAVAAPRPGPRGGARGDGTAGTWQQVGQFTADAVDILADGSTTISLASLAERLCAVQPDTLAADPPVEAVRCPPKVELSPLGHTLELELGRPSSIGLFARELSDKDSAQLVRQAQQQLAGACREAWSAGRSSADNAHEEFHTCTTGTGAVLVLGRFPLDLGANRWQFSLVVLGPG